MTDTAAHTVWAQDRVIQCRRPLSWNGPGLTLLGLCIAVLAGWLLAALPPREGALFVVLVVVVVGSLVEPFVGLGVALLAGPLKAYLNAEVPSVPGQVGHAFVVLALGSWLIGQLSARQVRIGDIRSPLTFALLAFLGAALLSLWDAVGLATHGILELVKWLEILLLFVFVKEHLGTGAGRAVSGSSRGGQMTGGMRRVRGLLIMLLLGGLTQALIGIWQFGLRGDGPDHFQILGGRYFRAYGTFEQPNPYAGYIGLTGSLAGGFAITLIWEWLRERVIPMLGRGRPPQLEGTAHRAHDQWMDWPLCLFSGVAAVAMSVALAASWSRGGWLGFGAAGLAMAAALPRRRGLGFLLVALLVGAWVSLYASGRLPADFTARLTAFLQDIALQDIALQDIALQDIALQDVRGVAINDANYAIIERLAHWQTALDMFRHRIWTGVGFGCYEAAYPAFALINWPIALGHAHNIYLNLAAEVGLIGLAAYVLLWGMVLIETWTITRRARGLLRALGVGLLGAWIHVSVHHLLDSLYVNNVHLHIAVLLGLTAFIARQTLKEPCIYDR